MSGNPEEWKWLYLCPDGDTFWDWSDTGDEIRWWNGGTLSFYQEIDLMMRRLQPHGLPRFEEILLVLSACRKTWPEADGPAAAFTKKIEQLDPDGWKDFPIYKWLNPLFEGLNRVHSLARKEGFGTEVSLAVLDAVFSREGDCVDDESAASLLKDFESGDVCTWVRNSKHREKKGNSRTPPLSLLQTVRNLVELLKTFSDSIDLKIIESTGLPAVVKPAELEQLPFTERLRGLIAELLVEGGELSGLARVATRLSALVNLPRRLSDPDELPLGGYTDVTNRGPIDRLMLSELAQDPDVLAVRVAMNEALYLRRESPPHEPLRQRMIFVDTGIRMWGVPRVYACAAALALAMQNPGRGASRVFTPAQASFVDAKIDSREGMIDLLGRLTPDPHPGVAVAELFRRESEGSEDADHILITTERVWQDAEFRRTISASRPESFHLVLVDRDGGCQLREVNHAGERELRKAQLDLDELLAEDGSVRNSKSSADETLPLFLRQDDCPLRLARGVVENRVMFHHEIGLIAHTGDGLLLQWKNPELGAVLLSTEFPKGRPVWMEIDPIERRAMYLFRRTVGRAMLFQVDIDGGKTYSVGLSVHFPLSSNVYVDGNIILLFCETEAIAFQLDTGQFVGMARLPKRCGLVHGGFVSCADGWHALQIHPKKPGAHSYGSRAMPMDEGSDSMVRLEKLPGQDLQLVWDHPEFPAPLSVDARGRVWCLSDPVKLVSNRLEGRECLSFALTSDQRHLAAWSPMRRSGGVLNILNHTIREIFGIPRVFELEPTALEIRGQIPDLRKNFTELYLTPEGGLHLCTKKDHLLTLEITGMKPQRLVWTQTLFGKKAKEDGWVKSVNRWKGEAVWDQRVKAAEFERVYLDLPGRFKIHEARTPDGSRALLDARGLLHLQSSDKSIPEVTMILKDGETSGWCSDGVYFGRKYFIGERKGNPKRALGYVERFVAHILKMNREEVPL
jgi:hypothetical protein